MPDKKIVLVLYLSVMLSSCAVFNTRKFSGTQKDTLKYIDWHHRDPKVDKIPGISTDLAYRELLKDKKPGKVIVAVIDGGIDISHRDLQGKIWKNTREIPFNRIDDDMNGYVDDTCGWNFLGNGDGRLINFETLEMTRLYKKYKRKYHDIKVIDTLSLNEKKEYHMFSAAYKEYQIKYMRSKTTYEGVLKFERKYKKNDSLVRNYVGIEKYNYTDLKRIKTNDSSLKEAVRFMSLLKKKKFNEAVLNEMKKHYEEEIQYQYNPDYNIREEVIGDDPEIDDGRIYGNNNVSHYSTHGTSVAGVIVRIHRYSQLLWGVPDSLQIMPIVVVPFGDERDKDVAKAIIYAVDNGARIINMSFGKAYSPQKHLVDRALKYAEKKNVLLIHAAGNESLNIDSIEHYPSPVLSDFTRVGNFINVGATGIHNNKNLVGNFSNFGKNMVDLFAPGVDIYSLKPGNRYDFATGTSFATPVVSGIASLLLAYYPELTAAQVKEILIRSVVNFEILKEFSVAGGVVNAYKALKLAQEYVEKKN